MSKPLGIYVAFCLGTLAERWDLRSEWRLWTWAWSKRHLRLMAHQIVHAYWDSALMGHVGGAPSRTFAAAHRAHVGFRAPSLFVVARNVRRDLDLISAHVMHINE